MVDNDIVLALVQDWGLKTVVKQLEISCERLAHFAGESEGGEGESKAYETDAMTIRKIIPLIIMGDDEAKKGE